MKTQWIFGKHAVMAALKAGRRTVVEVWAVDKYSSALDKLKIKAHFRPAKTFDDQFKGKVHQGIAAQVGPLPPVHLNDVAQAEVILLLDQVTDPHNLGAILRTADALGAAAVVVPEHGAAQLNDTAMKTAAGAAESVPLVVVGNLNQAIQTLQKENFWVVGLAGEAEQPLQEIDLSTGKIALVMGSEGEGLRPLVAKNCDFLAHLPMCGLVSSLNVSVATGVALYEVLRQRKK